jgi:hypothetical protein
MPPQFLQASTATAVGCFPKAGALVLLPAAIHLLRSSSSTSSLSGVPRPPFADQARRVIQGVLALLPHRILHWLCSEVLSLPAELAEQTADLLKGRETIWQMLGKEMGPRQGEPETSIASSPRRALLEAPPTVEDRPSFLAAPSAVEGNYALSAFSEQQVLAAQPAWISERPGTALEYHDLSYDVQTLGDAYQRQLQPWHPASDVDRSTALASTSYRRRSPDTRRRLVKHHID